MIYDVSNKIVNKFTGDWIDRKTGLVRVIKSGDKKLPFSNSVNESDCNAKLAMSPNEAYKSVLYLEKVGDIQNTPIESGHFTSVVDFRLVCWLNGKKLGDNSGEVADDVIRDIMRQVKGWGTFNLDSFNSVKVKIISIEDKDYQKTFGKYGADEGFRFYVKPYDFFALRIRVSFTANCLTFIDSGNVC